MGEDGVGKGNRSGSLEGRIVSRKNSRINKMSQRAGAILLKKDRQGESNFYGLTVVGLFAFFC